MPDTLESLRAEVAALREERAADIEELRWLRERWVSGQACDKCARELEQARARLEDVTAAYQFVCGERDEARALLARGLDRCDCATGACEWHTDVRAFLAPRRDVPCAEDEDCDHTPCCFDAPHPRRDEGRRCTICGGWDGHKEIRDHEGDEYMCPRYYQTDEDPP